MQHNWSKYNANTTEIWDLKRFQFCVTNRLHSEKSCWSWCNFVSCKCICGVFQFITDPLCFCLKGKLKQMRAQTKKHRRRNRKKIMIITEVMNRYCWNITFELRRISSCSAFGWFKTAFLSEGISRCVALTPRFLNMLSG